MSALFLSMVKELEAHRELLHKECGVQLNITIDDVSDILEKLITTSITLKDPDEWRVLVFLFHEFECLLYYNTETSKFSISYSIVDYIQKKFDYDYIYTTNFIRGILEKYFSDEKEDMHVECMSGGTKTHVENHFSYKGEPVCV